MFLIRDLYSLPMLALAASTHVQEQERQHLRLLVSPKRLRRKKGRKCEVWFKFNSLKIKSMELQNGQTECPITPSKSCDRLSTRCLRTIIFRQKLLRLRAQTSYSFVLVPVAFNVHTRRFTSSFLRLRPLRFRRFLFITYWFTVLPRTWTLVLWHRYL